MWFNKKNETGFFMMRLITIQGPLFGCFSALPENQPPKPLFSFPICLINGALMWFNEKNEIGFFMMRLIAIQGPLFGCFSALPGCPFC